MVLGSKNHTMVAFAARSLKLRNSEG